MSYQTPEGYRQVMCDCTCATPCPNGKVGSAYRCIILQKIEDDHERMKRSIKERTDELLEQGPEACRAYIQELTKDFPEEAFEQWGDDRKTGNNFGEEARAEWPIASGNNFGENLR